jgi:uridine kinase
LSVAGICGGSASGKTTVATKIIESLDVPWVTLLSMDSFYKVKVKATFRGLFGTEAFVQAYCTLDPRNFLHH